jgi:hypothetical protein
MFSVRFEMSNPRWCGVFMVLVVIRAMCVAAGSVGKCQCLCEVSLG